MEESYQIRLYIKGKRYTERKAHLASAVEVISGYEESLSQCLKIAAKQYTPKDEKPPIPDIGLVSSRTSSLDLTTLVDFMAVAGPVASQLPDVVTYALDLYKNASELLGIVTKYFNKTERPIVVNINDSPGATPIINVGSGSVTIGDVNILNAAKVTHHGFNKMAEQVTSGFVDSIEVQPLIDVEDQDNHALYIDKDSKSNYTIPWKKSVDDKLLKIKCGIFSFNKRSGNGRLDILDEELSASYPFEVHGIKHDLGVDAMSAIYSKVSATREMKVNALGETQIKKLHIHSIENIFGEPAPENENSEGSEEA